ncbi:serine-rich adhesin for platelets-like [Sycon ciliatum]|uniref:serine-rich adhesin for platelets-like n=1 Tax=Sycon ciliatum TaxID=27933 RepID=UPI0031F6A306
MVSDTPHIHATSNQGSPGSEPVLPDTDKTSSTVQPATVKSSEAPTTASSSVVLGMAAGMGALILLLLLVLLVVLLKRRAKIGSFTLLRRTRISVSLTMMNSAFQHISTQEEDHELWQGGSMMNVYETSTTLGNPRSSLASRTSGSEFNADIDQDEADAYLRTADELNMSRRLSTDTTVTLMSVHTQSSETNLSEYNAAAESPSTSASSDAHLPTKGGVDGRNFQPSAKPAKRTLLGRKASVAPSVPMDLTEEIYTSPTRTPLAASRDESSLDISLNTRSKSGLASDTYALPVDVIASHTASRLCSSTTKITDTSADLHTVHIHTDDDYCTPKDAIHKVKKFLETESIDVTGRHDSAEQAAGGTAGTRTSANDDKTNTSLTALAQSQPTVPLQQGSLGNDYLEGTKHRSFDRELEFLTDRLQSEAASWDSVTGNQGLLKSDHVPSLVTVQEDPIKFRPVSASDTTLCQTPTAGTHSTATDVVSTTKANPALAGQTATSDECYASPADAVRHLATDVYAEETYQLPNDAVRSVIGNTCKDDAAATPRELTQLRRSESRPTSIALSGASGAQQGVLLVEEDTYIMPADSIKPGTVRHTAQSGITPTTDSDMVTHQATTSTVSTTDPGADIADAYQLPADIKLEQAAAGRTDKAGMDPADTYAMPADAIGVRSTPKAEAQIVAPSTIAAHNPTDPTPRREVYAQVQPKSQRMRETGDSNVSSHSSGAGEPTTATSSVAGDAPPTIPPRYRKTSWHGEQADIDIGNQQYKSSKWSNMFSHVKRKISAGRERRTEMKQPGSPRTSRPLPSPLPEEVAPGNLIQKTDDSNALAEEPQYMLCGPQLISQLSMPSDTTSLSKMAAALPSLPRRNTAPPAPEDVLGPIYSLATTSTLSGQAATAEKAYDNASTSSSITHVHTFESDLDQEMYAELQVQDTPQRLLPATDNTSQIDTAMLQNTSNMNPDCRSEVYAEIGVAKIDKKSTPNTDSCYAAPVDAMVAACASHGTRGQDKTYAAPIDAVTSACESDSTRGQDETYAAPIDAITSACESDSTRGQDETYATPIDAVTSAWESDGTRGQDETYTAPIDTVPSACKSDGTRGQDETYAAPVDAKMSAYESDSTRGQDETFATPVDAIKSASESNSTRRQDETYAAPVDALTSAYESDSTRGQDETYAAPVDAVTSACKSDSTRGQEETYATPIDAITSASESNSTRRQDETYAAPIDALTSAYESDGTRGQDETYAAPVDAVTSACKSDCTRGQEETYATPLDSLNVVKKGTPLESKDTAHAHAANNLKLAQISPSSTADTAGKAETGSSSLGVYDVPVDAITST